MTFGMKFGLGLLAMGVFVANASAATIFDADFNGSTEVVGAVTDNASVANLDAGTAVGSWALSGSGGGNPGAIIDNAASDNNAFVLDTGVSGSGADRARGNFTETVGLHSGVGATLEFDIYAARQGASNRQVRVSLDDPSGEKAYVLIFQALGNTSGMTQKRFTWLDTSNGQNTIVTNVAGPNTFFLNPADGSYLGWTDTGPSEPAVPIRVKIEVDGATTLSDTGGGPPTTGAKVTIDWDGDGVINGADGDIADFVIGPRKGGVQQLSSLELFYGGGGNRGAYFDNITVTPEPASLALLALGGLMMVRRRTA